MRHSWRAIALALTLVLFGAMLVDVGTSPHADAAISDTPNTSIPSVETIGTIETSLRDGDLLYIAGDFTSVMGVQRGGLAAIDLSTNTVTSWNPNICGNSFPSTCESDSDINVKAMAIDGTGSSATIYLGGSFKGTSSEDRTNLMAIPANSNHATAWNPIPDAAVTALSIDSASSPHRVYVGGDFSNFGEDADIARSNLAAFEVGDSEPLPFDVSSYLSNTTINALNVDPSIGTLYVGGNFTISPGGSDPDITNLVAFDTDTAEPTSWQPNPDGVVNTIVRDESGTSALIYIGGNFTHVGSDARGRLAAIPANSSSATSWNPGASNSVKTLAITGTGSSATLLVTGTFGILGGQTRFSVGQLAANTNAATSFNTSIGFPSINTAVDDSSRNQIIIGGMFPSANSQNAWSLGTFSTATSELTNDFNVSLPGSVLNTVADGDYIYIGGKFNRVGNKYVTNLAQISRSTNQATNFSTTFVGGGANFQVMGLALDDDTLYVGGNFTEVGGETRSNLAALDTADASVKAWNPGANNIVSDFVIDGTGSSATIYVGGAFTTLGGATRHGLGAVPANSDSATSFDPDLSVGAANNGGGYTASMELSGSGSTATLYVGGSFGYVGTDTRNNFAAIDVSTSQATSLVGNLTSGGDPTAAVVYELALDGNDGRIYLAGTFDEVNGQSRTGLAAFDTSTETLLPWTAEINIEMLHMSGWVFSLAVDGIGDDATIYFGGIYDTINGDSSPGINAVDGTGTVLSWSPSIPILTYSLTLIDGPTKQLITGGATLGDDLYATDITAGTSGAYAFDINATPPTTTTTTTAPTTTTTDPTTSTTFPAQGQKLPIIGDKAYEIKNGSLITHTVPLPSTVLPVKSVLSSNGKMWSLGADGGIFTSPGAKFWGSLGGMHLVSPVVSMALYQDGQGYWVTAQDGGVFSFGHANYFGSMAGTHLNDPVVDIQPTKSGNGYWLTAGDGGVFSFGDARFHGSMANFKLNKPVTAIARTASGDGYYLLGKDGGVFTFGDARYCGSTRVDSPKTAEGLFVAGVGDYYVTYSDGTAAHRVCH